MPYVKDLTTGARVGATQGMCSTVNWGDRCGDSNCDVHNFRGGHHGNPPTLIPLFDLLVSARPANLEFAELFSSSPYCTQKRTPRYCRRAAFQGSGVTRSDPAGYSAEALPRLALSAKM